MSLDKEIYEANKLLSSPHIYEDYSSIIFSKYSPTYVGTNEKIRELLEVVKVDDKDVLCPTCSGDFALNCLVCNAKSVTTFDINVFAKHVFYLKIAAIRTFSQSNDFKKFFTVINNGGINPDIFSRDMFYKISDNLPEDSFIWWKNAYHNFKNLYESSLFRGQIEQTLGFQEKHNIYFDDNKYEILRERLRNTHIDIYDLSLTDLPTLENVKSFDFIYLSNILQYYKDITELDNYIKIHQFVKERLTSLLNDKGILGVCYRYFNGHLDNKEYICNRLLNEFSRFYSLEIFGCDSSPGMEDAIILYKKFN